MSTKLGDITLTKQSGTILTLNTEGKYVPDDKYFTIAAQSGAGTVTIASTDASIESDETTRNISGIIGTKSTAAPSSGYYLKVNATGNGSSTITTPGWLDSGSLGTATATGSFYFPVAQAQITRSIADYHMSNYFNSGNYSNYDVLITPMHSVTTAGYAPVATDVASFSYYYRIKKATPNFDGGDLSGTATASGNGATISSTTNNSGVSITTACTASRGPVCYNGAVNGWVTKDDNSVALSSGSQAMTPTTYYLNGVTLTTPESGNRTFAITLPNGDNDTITLTFKVDSSGNWSIE